MILAYPTRIRGTVLSEFKSALRMIQARVGANVGSWMVNSRWTDPDVNREDIQRLLDEGRPVVERCASVELRCRHPQLPVSVDPHGVYPKETFIMNKGGPRAIR